MYILIVILVLVGVLLIWLATRRQREVGLPAGRVVYDDASRWGKVERPLFDLSLSLTGKPDYIIAQNGCQIPVEVKSSMAPISPYENHVYQLMAYCMLVEHTSGTRPPYGILRYRNRTFEIDYTPELEKKLLEVMAEMRQPQRRNGPERSHEEAVRCAHCGFRAHCDQGL